jgi:hypothetical protein
MTKRSNKQAGFFCLPDELTVLLEPILVKNGAQLCVANEKGGRYCFRKAVFPQDLNAVDLQFYTYVSTMADASGLGSPANLVQVWFPSLRDGRLRMGRIAMLATDSDMNEDHRKFQEKIYRDIYNALVKSFRRGVLGKNSRTGGEHYYKNIFISERAALAYIDGVSLATLMGDGFVSYHVNHIDGISGATGRS